MLMEGIKPYWEALIKCFYDARAPEVQRKKYINASNVLHEAIRKYQLAMKGVAGSFEGFSPEIWEC